MYKKCRKDSFTLIELMVVVIIVGILAGIIVPNHMRAREKAMDKQAKVILSLIRAAERNYKMETGNYVTSGSTPGAINSALNLDIADDGNWAYSLSNTNSFTATMTRNKGGFGRTWTITANMVNATCSGNCP